MKSTRHTFTTREYNKGHRLQLVNDITMFVCSTQFLIIHYRYDNFITSTLFVFQRFLELLRKYSCTILHPLYSCCITSGWEFEFHCFIKIFM